MLGEMGFVGVRKTSKLRTLGDQGLQGNGKRAREMHERAPEMIYLSA